MYKGYDPYIFISYAHKDSETVMPLIHGLENNHFRLWYDNGIEAGSEWPEFIAEKLMNSKVVIAFISANSIASHNCRREINFAIDEKIELLVVYLEDLKLSPGMRLQLNTLQALYKTKYNDTDSFLTSLCSANILKPCLEDIPTTKAHLEEEPSVKFSTSPAVEEEPSVKVSTSPAVEEEPSVEVSTSPAVEEDLSVEVLNSPAVEEDLSVEVLNSPAVEEEPSVEVSTSPAVEEEPSVEVLTSTAVEEEPSVDVPNASAEVTDSIFVEKNPPINSQNAEQSSTDDIIYNIIDEYIKTQPESVFKLKHAKDLKTQQIKNAIKHYAKDISAEDVIAFVDLTVTKSGKSGFLFAKNAFYVNFMTEENSFLYKEIKHAKPDESEVYIKLYLRDGTITNVASSTFADYACRILNSISEIFDNYTPPKEDNQITSAIYNACYETGFENNLRSKRELSTKQIRNANKNFSNIVSDDEIVAIFDTTLIKNGKEGWLITEDSLYFIDKSYPQLIFTELSDVEQIDSTHILIKYKNGTEKSQFQNIYTECLCLFLKQIIKQQA